MGMFRKAERRKAKLRLGISGPSGSGKTYSSLLIAKGLGSKIALIDTENGSGDLYANLFEYDVCTLSPPYTPSKYIEAIKAAEEAGYEVIIIDSLSHAWAGEGGLLDQQGKIADRGGNSFAAWRQVTPQHNQLVDAMLQSKCHIIATMRAKTEYVQTVENGKTVIKKVGLAPVQRDGMEYEFTICFDLDQSHIAQASKDRTGIFDQQFFKPTPETGKKLLEWLENGTEIQKPADKHDKQAAEGILTLEAALEMEVPIGKHKGKKLADCPDELLSWYIKNLGESKPRFVDACSIVLDYRASLSDDGYQGSMDLDYN